MTSQIPVWVISVRHNPTRSGSDVVEDIAIGHQHRLKASRRFILFARLRFKSPRHGGRRRISAVNLLSMQLELVHICACPSLISHSSIGSLAEKGKKELDRRIPRRKKSGVALIVSARAVHTYKPIGSTGPMCSRTRGFFRDLLGIASHQDCCASLNF